MRARSKSLLACLVGVALAVPAIALAQSGSVTQYPSCPDPPPKLSPAEYEAAKASYKVGVEAFENSDYKKALDNIKDAFRRDCSKVALLEQLARIYESLGDKPEAIHALEVYLQRNPKADDAEKVQTRIQNLKAQLPAVTTTSTTTATTATATVTSTAPTVTATATSTSPEEVQGHTAGPWVLIAIGGVGVAVGTVMLLIGQGEVSKSREGCASNGSGQLSCTPPLTTPGDNQDRKQLNSNGTTISNVGLIVGAVCAADLIAGLVWHFVEPTGPKKVGLFPTFAPGYAGLSFGGKF
jgi:hypothetical protein